MLITEHTEVEMPAWPTSVMVVEWY